MPRRSLQAPGPGPGHSDPIHHQPALPLPAQRLPPLDPSQDQDLKNPGRPPEARVPQPPLLPGLHPRIPDPTQDRFRRFLQLPTYPHRRRQWIQHVPVREVAGLPARLAQLLPEPLLRVGAERL